MIIQHLLMPKSGICDQNDMFSRVTSGVYFTDMHQTLTFQRYGTAWFDTYFNGLSISKWKKYTRIGKVSLTLRLSGKFEICLLRKIKIHGLIVETELLSEPFESEEECEVTLQYPQYDESGMYFFRLTAYKANSRFFGGYYSAEISEDELRRVDIAMNICTFKREAFVKRNVETLRSKILNDPNSKLYGHLQIFISDNGKTLDAKGMSDSTVHVVPNKNVGGAGGFTRGLIEIMKCPAFNATHVLFMDDDVVIEPEAIFRTYTMLRCAKEEYADAFIGGAMLRLDHQNIQVEAGAAWNAGELESRKCGLDLNTVDACLYNEVEEYVEFNAWWYCCVPMTVVRPDNLPLPIFIRGDDLEYGMRNMKHLILMNGICVWHEPFENKYSSFLNYYIIRNLLYDNALHCPDYSKRTFLKRLWGSVTRELMYYRYNNAELIFRGVRDFYRGVDFLKETDGERLHKEIMSAGYRAAPMDSLDMPFTYPTYQNSMCEKEGKARKLLRLVTFNGYFLPAKRENIVPMASCRPINFYRASRVMHYDVTSGKGFITEKSIRRMFSCLGKLFRLTVTSLFKFRPALLSFRTRSGELTNTESWQKYLEEAK